MSNRNALLEELAHVALFQSCSRRELERIARAADEVTIEAGRALVQQGATGHEAFVIITGEASVTRDGVKIATLGHGDPVGELAVLDGGPRTATVTAETDLEVLVIGQREFSALMTDVPSLSRKVMVNLARRVRELDERVYG